MSFIGAVNKTAQTRVCLSRCFVLSNENLLASYKCE
jgi:hypothetical protein